MVSSTVVHSHVNAQVPLELTQGPFPYHVVVEVYPAEFRLTKIVSARKNFHPRL